MAPIIIEVTPVAQAVTVAVMGPVALVKMHIDTGVGIGVGRRQFAGGDHAPVGVEDRILPADGRAESRRYARG